MFELQIQSLDVVAEAHREFYEPDPDDGGFRLKVRGIDKLLNSKRNEKELRLAVEKHNRELTARVRDLEAKPAAKPEAEFTPREKFIRDNAHRLDGLNGEARDAMVATITDEMQAFIDEELAARRKTHETEVESLSNDVCRLTAENAARDFIKAIAIDGDAFNVLFPHVVKRFRAEKRGDGWASIITDAAGNPSRMSSDALLEEFRSRPEFKRLVRTPTAAEIATHQARVAAAIGRK